MNKLAMARGKAYALDCVAYLGIATATVPLGILAYRAGWGEQRGAVLAMSAIPPVIATVLAARQESGPERSTWGKRRQGLVVAGKRSIQVGFGRALLRNTIKIAIPWQIGHTLAVGAAFGGFEDRDPTTIVASVLTYVGLGVLIGSVLYGEGRGVHDRLAHTRVLAEA
ncbi:MAG: hypothetical protein GEU79_07075 [Acidimicrobiia bacterium]|nr:hypothetical protein [Acidimicrobiia bacterium]